MGSLALLGDSFGMLTGEGSVLNLIGAALVFTLGGVVHIVDKVVRVFAVLTVGLGYVFRVIGMNLRRLVTGNWKGSVIANQILADEAKAVIGPLLDAAMRGPKWDQGKFTPPEVPTDRDNNNTYIDTVNINQTVNTRMGHREIAGAFDLLIERTNRYRSQARRVAVPAV
jgi:hypothetical protein